MGGSELSAKGRRRVENDRIGRLDWIVVKAIPLFVAVRRLVLPSTWPL
jgi:hypothetical protein